MAASLAHFVLRGDLLFERRHDGGDFVDLLLPLGNLRPDGTQFAAAGNQSAGGVSLADDERAVGGQQFAGQA